MSARKQMLDDFAARVGLQLESRLELEDGEPVSEIVRMITHARPKDLERFAAWACVLWDQQRRRG